jgi:hypothetical protein
MSRRAMLNSGRHGRRKKMDITMISVWPVIPDLDIHGPQVGLVRARYGFLKGVQT